MPPSLTSPPVPFRAPRVWYWAAEASKTPPVSTVTLALGARLPFVPSLSVPPLMVTPPVMRLAPSSVCVPVPVLVSVPVPEMTPP